MKYLIGVHGCCACTEAKEWLAENNITDVTILDGAKDKEAMILAKKFKLADIPRFIVTHDKEPKREDAFTVYTVDEYKALYDE